MKNFNLTNKFIILFSLLATLFNLILIKEYKIFTLCMTVLFLILWINFIVYKLSIKDVNEKVVINSITYFVVLAISSILSFILTLFNVSFNNIVLNVLNLILMPLNGLSYLLGQTLALNIFIFIITLIFIIIIKRISSDE